MAHHAPEVLDKLVTAEWAERYERPVRLCSQPSHPGARLAQVGADARELLGRLGVRFPGSALPAQAEVLGQILVQHFLVPGGPGSSLCCRAGLLAEMDDGVITGR